MDVPGCATLSKTFPRKLLAKSASIQTVVCVPFMNGVLELGTTDPVSEEPNVVNRITTAFWNPTSSSSPSPHETGDANIVLFDDHLVHRAIEDKVSEEEEEEELGDAAANVEQTAMEIDEMIYSLCCEGRLDDGSCSRLLHHVFVSPALCFVAWKRTDFLDKEEAAAAAVAAGGESSSAQKLLRKALEGGALIKNNNCRAAGNNSIKNHVISERRRRERPNEMFLILKSLVPSIGKVDKASILAETIAYLKELEKRLQELESSSELPSRGRQECEIAGKNVSGASSEVAAGDGGGGGERGSTHHWVLSQEGHPSDVHVIVMDKELHLEVQCRWKEFLMTRVFDAIKSLRLDVLSVQASAPDGLLGL